MNNLLKTIKHDLKVAMKIEVEIRKNPAEGDFIVSQQGKLENAIAHKTVSRAIISMIPELGMKPEDTKIADIYKLLKKYAGNEKERQLYIGKHITESDVAGISASDLKKLVKNKIQELGTKLDTLVIIIAESYLPKGPTEEEIGHFIKDHLDLSQFKNKMQAMGSIMKAFPGCDGNFVKNILLKL